jgi:Asp-tRNA(Asn)/Glu-tRNA(Gln) amidotransferase A subunit family amidase
LFIDPVRKVRVLTTAGPVARSIADLRLALQLIGGPDGLVAARGEDGQLAPPRREAWPDPMYHNPTWCALN